ncbi:helix-turn-helix domain-containing protein [Salibacterium salarium]|uniref:Helix-turn-helix domain-containing protein n=1 Tax=Salibacterium salarium TaxID=284579 RepID=A0A3R9WM58_9BACI|nr:helix-turn-helix domain-containing protein [Salibacterium salarium]RSL29311.1 helix-turn-helix domain-containing protein [Salibacterium salarium]
MFGNKLKKEREKREWSQEYLAEKIHVSRQSISKWETGKNYPSIEVIIDLSDLFGITIDKLLRSDEKLKEKVVQDSKQKLSWQSHFLFGIGVLIGVVIVSTIKNDGINWISAGEVVGITALLFLTYLFIRKGIREVEQRK